MHNELQKKLNTLYESLQKHILHIRLAHKVDDKQINLHYMRALKACVKKIKLFIFSEDENLLNALINKATELLIIKSDEKTEVSEGDETPTPMGDLEDSAQNVNKPSHTSTDHVKAHIKTTKGAQRHAGRSGTHNRRGDK